MLNKILKEKNCRKMFLIAECLNEPSSNCTHQTTPHSNAPQPTIATNSPHS